MEELTTVPTTVPVYEPPVLVELGEFSEDTLGGPGFRFDSADYLIS